jgi:hypothetical protein
VAKPKLVVDNDGPFKRLLNKAVRRLSRKNSKYTLDDVYDESDKIAAEEKELGRKNPS